MSSTVHDRSKIVSSAPVSGNVSSSSTTSRQSRVHHHHHHNEPPRRASSTTPTGGSSATARDTFLNYFFGQQPNGSSPSVTSSGISSGIGLSAAMLSGSAPHARDLHQSPPLSGLLAGKNGPDGSNSALDMKSLSKHIEAVRFFYLVSPRGCNPGESGLTDCVSICRFPPIAILSYQYAKRWKRH